MSQPDGATKAAEARSILANPQMNQAALTESVTNYATRKKALLAASKASNFVKEEDLPPTP